MPDELGQRRRRRYVNSATAPSLFWLDVKEFNFKPGAPLLFLDPHDLKLAATPVAFASLHFAVTTASLCSRDNGAVSKEFVTPKRPLRR